MLWIDKQTKRGNKKAEKVVGQKKPQINISLWNVLALKRDLLGQLICSEWVNIVC